VGRDNAETVKFLYQTFELLLGIVLWELTVGNTRVEPVQEGEGMYGVGEPDTS
jgi:hypothetical protein